MRGGKVVNHDQVTLLPTVVDHILVGSLADLVHFPDTNGGTVSKGNVQGHFLSPNAILPYGASRNLEGVFQEPHISSAAKGSKQLCGEGRPMKDLGMVEPNGLVGDWVALKRFRLEFTHKHILVLAFPAHGHALLLGESFYGFLVVGSKELGPSQHGSDIVGVFGPNLVMGTSVAKFLGSQFGTKALWQILVDLGKSAKAVSPPTDLGAWSAEK